MQQRSRRSGAASGSTSKGLVASGAPAKPKVKHVSAFHKTALWDSKFSAHKKTVFSALGRMSAAGVRTHTATFKLGSEAAAAASETAEGTPPSATLKFPVTQPLMVLQQSVAQEFGWNVSSVLYLTDSHGWERPVASDTELEAAFKNWDETSGPRTRNKYDALFKEVEELLSSGTYSEQLSGAGAAWEISCRDSHHQNLSDGFLEALHAMLTVGSFAPATHAAAAVSVEPQDALFPGLLRLRLPLLVHRLPFTTSQHLVRHLSPPLTTSHHRSPPLTTAHHLSPSAAPPLHRSTC